MIKEIKIIPRPQAYKFTKGGYDFICEMTWRNEINVHPIDALICDLEECIIQLKHVPKFKIEKPFELPPLKPENEEPKE